MKHVIIIGALLCALGAPLKSEIKAGDSLQVLLRGVPGSEKEKVEGQYVVGASGTIRVPLAEVAVMAAGLTPEALARKIEAVYREHEIYTRPSIEVVSKEIEKPVGAEVSVGGHVKRAGPIPFRNGMTLLQAVQAAGDFDAFGSQRRVYLTRGEKLWVADLRTKEGQQLRLEAGDTVRVDRRGPFEGN